MTTDTPADTGTEASTEAEKPAGAWGTRLSDRARSWLMFAIVFNITMALMAVWALYAATHIQSRYVATDPGTPVIVQESEFTLVKLTRTDVVLDGEEEIPSYAGSSWVIAELEVTLPHPIEYPLCSAQLLAVGERTWEPWSGDNSGFYDRKLKQYCDEVKPKQPYRFEQIFQIPDRYADQISGVIIEDNSNAAPVPVMRV